MEQSVVERPGRRDAKQVFVGRHLRAVTLTGAGSEKHTEHHEISLEHSGVVYLPGDALGVYATNDPASVERVIQCLGATGNEVVRGLAGAPVSLADALTTQYSIATPTRRLIELLAARGADDLAPLLQTENTHAFKHFVSGKQAHDTLEVLESHPRVHVEPQELIDALRTLLPRLYSIASSQRVYPDALHVVVVSLTYTLRNRHRAGVASTWINNRWATDATARMYVQDQQKHFALPDDPSRPLIMVGPGTGVAPFRAFLQDRRASGAPGKNWLFFGEQHRATEFFYEDEFTAMVRDGFLRLDTAFSRDQADKIYVQHRMRAGSADLWSWLEDGAAFYVCGDKERMAADVDAELHRIIESEGGQTPDQAKAYVDQMRAAGRYRRDVY